MSKVIDKPTEASSMEFRRDIELAVRKISGKDLNSTASLIALEVEKTGVCIIATGTTESSLSLIGATLRQIYATQIKQEQMTWGQFVKSVMQVVTLIGSEALESYSEGDDQPDVSPETKLPS